MKLWWWLIRHDRGCTSALSTRCFKSMYSDSIVRSLRTGDKIEIRGFGSFRTRQRQPRVGRNPKTGARVEVPAKKIPYFKPSKELKDVVNNAAERAGAQQPAFTGEPNSQPAPETQNGHGEPVTE